MTVDDLITELSKYPLESNVQFMLFSSSNLRRCDVLDSDVMIKQCQHNGEVNVMVNIPTDYEEECFARRSEHSSNIDDFNVETTYDTERI